ncbi:mycofactocin precursor MftA [Burkholderia sp. Ax-1719]|uniref:mycofactocin precursor MftA n=1 Tax=Burkholderia sp. Ax-1719 TaxID=2608334 RepID=UPI001423E9F0|nr:mycofactocin precursor MftA [Burkholderia sp. Ax-1719]NIE66902.1 mycofactocin precursor [Burkholderia sp. Ax-1719]
MGEGIEVKQYESESIGASNASQSKDTSDRQPFEECDCEELIEEVSIDGMCGVY